MATADDERIAWPVRAFLWLFASLAGIACMLIVLGLIWALYLVLAPEAAPAP